MRLIETMQLKKLYDDASNSERLRSHLLLHKSHEERVQRLIIAMMKGSYVEPHFHELPHQWEMFTVVDGVIKVTLYSLAGEVLTIFNAGPLEGLSVIEFAAGDIHSIECLSPTALLLEIKEGPFDPKYAKSFPRWVSL